MTVNQYGMGPTITAQRWSELFYKQAEGGAGDYVSGLKPTVASGTRQVQIASGSAASAGVLVDSDTAIQVNLDEAASRRIDVIVLQIDWPTLTASVEVIKGIAIGYWGFGSLDDVLTRDAGNRWQVPLAMVNVQAGVGQLDNDAIRDYRPTRRQKQIFRPNILSRTINNNNSGPVKVGTADIPYPGFDYRLSIDAQVNMSFTSDGFGELHLEISSQGRVRSSRAGDQNGSLAMLHYLSGKLTVATTVDLFMQRQNMSGNALQSYPSYSWLDIELEPF